MQGIKTTKENAAELLSEIEGSIRKLANNPSGVAYKDGSEPDRILRAADVPVGSGLGGSENCKGFLIADHDNKVTMMTYEEFKQTFHFVDIVTGEPVKEQKTEGPDEEAT